jgi:hypothetical protein
MALNDLTGDVRNRTIDDAGVRLDGKLWDIPPITGTGVSPTQAAAIAGPLALWIAQLPYQLDERGRLDYRSNTISLSHKAELTYGPGHPLAGQTIEALYSDGSYINRFGGAPMPYIDFDNMPPYTLELLLGLLTDIRNAMLNAT